MVGVVGIAAIAFGLVVSNTPSAPAPTSAPVPAKVAEAPAQTAPPPSTVPDSVPPPTDTSPSEAAPAVADVAPGPQRLGKLTLRGHAGGRRVYLDGKRLLGRGKRTFLVYCGTHTIALDDKAKAQGVDIPCNGELVIAK